MSLQFTYSQVPGHRGDAAMVPMLPIELRLPEGKPMHVSALLDSGATVNVLPWAIGIQLGAVWERQTTRVVLAGSLGTHEARALLVEGRVADFPAVPLAFAWTRAENVPGLLGQINFFHEFDICFHRARQQFELAPAVR